MPVRQSSARRPEPIQMSSALKHSDELPRGEMHGSSAISRPCRVRMNFCQTNSSPDAKTQSDVTSRFFVKVTLRFEVPIKGDQVAQTDARACGSTQPHCAQAPHLFVLEYSIRLLSSDIVLSLLRRIRTHTNKWRCCNVGTPKHPDRGRAKLRSTSLSDSPSPPSYTDRFSYDLAHNARLRGCLHG